MEHVSGLHPFSWLNDIPLFGESTACFSVLQLVDVWTVSTAYPPHAPLPCIPSLSEQ